MTNTDHVSAPMLKTTPVAAASLNNPGHAGGTGKTAAQFFAAQASRQELMTVGDLIAALAKLDQAAPVALGFLPVEGGHRGADAIEVPFSVDPIEDEGGKLVLVCLTEA